MLIEHIRYYVREDRREALLAVRREINRAREHLGLPPGYILLADPDLDASPTVVWQCGYENEDVMATVTTSLIGNEEYEAGRARLAELVDRVELEIYTVEEDAGQDGIE